MTIAESPAKTCASSAPVDKQQAINRLMGLAVFGEMVAARTYVLMSQLKPEFATLLKKFANMEGQHATWFRDASKANGIEPDKEFADHELDYSPNVNDHHAAGDFSALAVVQGSSSSIALYEPFIAVADKYPSVRVTESWTSAYHVDWVTRYLQLSFFDEGDTWPGEIRVNVARIDCIGKRDEDRRLPRESNLGADCARRDDGRYTELLERVGIEQKKAAKNVVGLFMPLIHKYRHGMKIK